MTWPDVLEKVALAAAVRAGHEQVTLGKHNFTLDYDAKRGTVYVSRADGIVAPCGVFNIERVLNAEIFLIDDKEVKRCQS